MVEMELVALIQERVFWFSIKSEHWSIVQAARALVGLNWNIWGVWWNVMLLEIMFDVEK